MPRAAWRDLANYAVALPSSAVAKVFNEYALPMIESIRCAIHESRILAAIRDALLPKLVSGEIHIKNAEKAVETEAESLAISK